MIIPPEFRWQALRPGSRIVRDPEKANGYDWFVGLKDGVWFDPWEEKELMSGLRIAVPKDWVMLLKARSSHGVNLNIVHAGVIDDSYRGEVKIILQNLSPEPYYIMKDVAVCQGLLLYVPYIPPVQYENIDIDTVRGEDGFGSTDSEYKIEQPEESLIEMDKLCHSNLTPEEQQKWLEELKQELERLTDVSDDDLTRFAEVSSKNQYEPCISIGDLSLEGPRPHGLSIESVQKAKEECTEVIDMLNLDD